MALLTLVQLKAYLRKDTTNEDTLLTDVLAEATAMAEVYLDRPISTLADQSYVDRAETSRLYGAPRSLRIPVTPVDPASVTVTDADGVASDAADYIVDAWTGLVTGVAGVTWSTGPYTITADVGLETDARYGTLIEPLVNALIRDLAADLYQHRNPASQSEAAGGGVSVAYTANGLPRRTAQMVAAFRYLKAVA
jgi:hypothetical protein